MDTILDDDFDWGTDIEDWSTDGFIESIGSSSSTDEDAIFSDIPTSFLIPFCMIFVAITIAMIMAMWKIFKKAGQEGWKSIIPIYNTYVLFEISGLKGWYVFLGFIPFFGRNYRTQDRRWNFVWFCSAFQLIDF